MILIRQLSGTDPLIALDPISKRVYQLTLLIEAPIEKKKELIVVEKKKRVYTKRKQKPAFKKTKRDKYAESSAGQEYTCPNGCPVFYSVLDQGDAKCPDCGEEGQTV